MPDSDYETPTPRPARVDTQIAEPSCTPAPKPKTVPCIEAHLLRASDVHTEIVLEHKTEIAALKGRLELMEFKRVDATKRLEGIRRLAGADSIIQQFVVDTITGLSRC